MSFAARRVQYKNGSILHIRPFKHPEYMPKLIKQHVVSFEYGGLGEDLNPDYMLNCVAENILVGWENLSYRGTEFLYSLETSRFLLTNSKETYRFVCTSAEALDSSLSALVDRIRRALEINLRWRSEDLDAAKRYEKKYGKVAPILQKARQGAGIASDPITRFYVEQFLNISKTRQTDFGSPERLSESHLSDYAAKLGYNSGEDYLFFRWVMTECDTEYLSYIKETHTTK